jgi:hypothetical protein
VVGVLGNLCIGADSDSRKVAAARPDAIARAILQAGGSTQAAG